VLTVGRMTPARTTNLFLVERYVPATDLDQLAAAVHRVAHRCGERRRARVEVEYVHSIYIPEEDTCFCVFRAPSTDAVREVNDAEGFVIDRVSAGFGFSTSGSRVPGERGTA
jgi:uncharacterized protein DUF4242